MLLAAEPFGKNDFFTLAQQRYFLKLLYKTILNCTLLDI